LARFFSPNSTAPREGPLGELDQFQQRALACARMPGDEQHFARGDREAHLAERNVAPRVLLADIVEAQDRHWRSIAGRGARVMHAVIPANAGIRGTATASGFLLAQE
jgi:hypothetical protein